MKLQENETALQLCSRGLDNAGEAPELQQLMQEAEKQAKACTALSLLLTKDTWLISVNDHVARNLCDDRKGPMSCWYGGMSGAFILSGMSCKYRRQRLQGRKRRRGSL